MHGAVRIIYSVTEAIATFVWAIEASVTIHLFDIIQHFRVQH